MGHYGCAVAAAAFPMSPIAWESEHHERERHYSSRGDQRASSAQMPDCSEADGTRWERIECRRTARICAGRRWDMIDRVC
jgi:hypothetical protein